MSAPMVLRGVSLIDGTGGAPIADAMVVVTDGRITAAGIVYRSKVHLPVDMKVDTDYGGRIAYWNDPDGHQWEILTVSYARQGPPAAAGSDA